MREGQGGSAVEAAGLVFEGVREEAEGLGLLAAFEAG
jgi:hypothetical protein